MKCISWIIIGGIKLVMYWICSEFSIRAECILSHHIYIYYYTSGFIAFWAFFRKWYDVFWQTNKQLMYSCYFYCQLIHCHWLHCNNWLYEYFSKLLTVSMMNWMCDHLYSFSREWWVVCSTQINKPKCYLIIWR